MCEVFFDTKTLKSFLLLAAVMNFVILFLIFFERGKCDTQPRIETVNGNLKISALGSKNIIFESSAGKILFNGDDFSATIESINAKVDQNEK